MWLSIAERSGMKAAVFGLLIYVNLSLSQGIIFPWPLDTEASSNDIVLNIKTPQGFIRTPADSSSFTGWLRQLPLKTKGRKVLLHNGRVKGNQTAQYRIINIDTGRQDLQQCADAVIRLRAEYLYFRKKFSEIHFNFTSGDQADYIKWKQGFRPKIQGSKVSWEKRAGQSSSYKIFRKYLKTVFIYAGSYSLSREMISVSNASEIEIGDVFIQGGFPGHAVIAVDMAEKNGSKAVLLAQSYMPAQEIHILKNPSNQSMSPWFIINETEKLYTPEWTFEWSDLKRFKNNE